MKRISWSKLKSGEVVSFRYKGKKPGAKSRSRTCLILNPKHMYKRKDGKRVRLVHAIQIKASPSKSDAPILTEGAIKKILKKAGSVMKISEGSYRVVSDKNYRDQYKELKNILSQFPIYRTFSWHICNTRALFIKEDFEWPKELIKEWENTSIPEVDEEDI